MERVAAGIDWSFTIGSFMELRRLEPLRDPDVALADADPLIDAVLEALRVVI